MPEGGPEIPKVDELVGEEIEEAGHFGRLIAIAVVLTTLIAALVAYAQASALRTHDAADYRAERWGALALNAGAVNRGNAEVQVERFNLLTQQVRQANTATLFGQYGSKSQANTLTAARWNAIAGQTESDTAAIAASQGMPYICAPSIQKRCSSANAFYSPEQDPQFPNRYIQQSQWPAYQYTALRDGANQQADDAEAKFVHYAAALTMLAVAVFLFGYSLTPQGQSRRNLYSRVAVVFVAVAGIWALYQVLTPVSNPPGTAAREFANGSVAAGDLSDQTAISDFSRALKLRPRFVDAYVQRAAAEYDAGIPHSGTGTGSLPTTAGGMTIASRRAIDQATTDLESARDAGSTSGTLFANLAAELTYRGLLEHNNSYLAQSHTYGEQAVDKLNDQENVAALLADTYFILAEDDLAQGHQAATEEYRAAEAQLRNPGVNPEFTVAAALTDLSLMETERPALAAKIDPLKEQIVAQGETYYAKGKPYETTPTGAAPSAGYASRAVSLGGIKAEPDPGHALYVINQPGKFDPAHDLLSAQWEYQDPLHGEWAVLPQISGPVTPGGLLSLNPGYASNNPSYVSNTSPATCMPPGHYRVQLFVNGHLAGTATASSDWSGLHAVKFSEVDGAMCVPVGWKPFPNLGAGADGYAAPDDSAGAFILSIPKAAVAAIANDQSALAGVMRATVNGFSSGGGSLLPGLSVAGKIQSTPFFMSSSNGQQLDWVYKNGYVYTGVGTAANGQIYIGIAWAHNNTQAYDQFLSLSPL